MNRELATCRRTWRRLGVDPANADEMAAELEADLVVAAADGMSAEEFVGGDAAGVARAWAAARGVVRPRYLLAGTFMATVAVVLPSVFAASYIYVATTSAWLADLTSPGWALVVPGLHDGVGAVRPFTHVPVTLFVAWYAVVAVAGCAGVCLAISAYLRRWSDPARRSTLRALGIALVPITAVAAYSTFGFTILTGYRADWPGQIGQYITFVVTFALGATLVRSVVVSRARRVKTSVSAMTPVHT